MHGTKVSVNIVLYLKRAVVWTSWPCQAAIAVEECKKNRNLTFMKHFLLNQTEKRFPFNLPFEIRLCFYCCVWDLFLWATSDRLIENTCFWQAALFYTVGFSNLKPPSHIPKTNNMPNNLHLHFPSTRVLISVGSCVVLWLICWSLAYLDCHNCCSLVAFLVSFMVFRAWWKWNSGGTTQQPAPEARCGVLNHLHGQKLCMTLCWTGNMSGPYQGRGERSRREKQELF